MTLLSKKLAEVQQRHEDESGRELAQVLDLGERIAQLDSRLISALDGVLEDHAVRRAEVHQRLETIAQCVGKMPAPAKLDSEPQQIQAAGDDTPMPDIIEREKRARREAHVANRVLPPANGHYQDHNGTGVQ